MLATLPVRDSDHRALFAALAALALLGGPVSASAQSSRGPQLRWDAPAGCPSGEEVLATLLERNPGPSQLRVEARVVAVEDGFELTLQTHAGGVTSERTLRGRHCGELVSATVLLVDLATASVAVEAPPLPPLYAEDPRELGDPHASPPPAPAPEVEIPEVEEPDSAGDVSLSLTPTLEFGALPLVAGGVEGAVQFAASELLRVGIGLYGTFPLLGELQGSDARARHEFYSARLTLGTEVRVRRAVFAPYAVGEGGALLVRAEGALLSDSNAYAWAAVGAGARLGVRFGRMGLGLEVEMRVPIFRPELRVSADVDAHYQTAPVVGRAGLRWQLYLK